MKKLNYGASSAKRLWMIGSLKLQKAIAPFVDLAEKLGKDALNFSTADPHGILGLVCGATLILVKVMPLRPKNQLCRDYFYSGSSIEKSFLRNYPSFSKGSGLAFHVLRLPAQKLM